MRSALAAWISAFSLATSVDTAWACGSGLPLFEDDFSTARPVWGPPEPFLRIGDGAMTIRATPNKVTDIVLRGHSFDDVDLCARSQVLETADPAQSGSGLVFWRKDPENFYLFMLRANGRAEVDRLQDGKWTALISTRQVPGAKTGNGSSNVLEVVTRGPDVTFYINGAWFEALPGQVPPPKGQRQVGLVGASPPAQRSTVSYTDLSITQPDSNKAGVAYRLLLRSGLGNLAPPDFVAGPANANLDPRRGLAEVSIPLTEKNGGARGDVVYRFYGSIAQANAYLSGSGIPPYSEEASAPGESLSLGHANVKGSETGFLYVSKMQPKAGTEWVRVLTRARNLVIMTTIATPRPGVAANDDIRRASLERAITIDNLALLRVHDLIGADPKP